MDSRRATRTVTDPKVRMVGFVTPGDHAPRRSLTVSSDPVSSAPVTSPTVADRGSPSSNHLSPVMIPLSRQAPVRMSPVPGQMSPLRDGSGPVMPMGSYNPSESLLGMSPAMVSPSSRVDGSEVGPSFSVSSGVMMPPGVSEKGEGVSADVQSEMPGGSKLKEKTTKAERRAKQEAQRAAKALAKGAGTMPSSVKQTKDGKPSQKNVHPATANIVASEKKDPDRLPEKDRKKDVHQVPQSRLQVGDKHRVEKPKKRAVVNQREAKNIVELFRHLPQYVHGTQLPDLESKFFQLDAIHPAVYKAGLQYLSGEITGGNARCIAMLLAFREAIRDYSTPPEKTIVRDLTAKIGSYVSFLIECRPLSISMGNAIRFLKNRIAKLPMSLAEADAKLNLQSDIDQFIHEKIVIADKAIVENAVTKISDGDVLLTYGTSCVVEMILVTAHELGKRFRVVIVDSRPKLEGQLLLRRLLAKGLSCTYTHINAISYIMHEVTRVFLGAASVLSNGTVYSRVGTASVAMVAHAFRVPVLVCCEAYKFHNRVQLDSICSNELGDPHDISKVAGRKDVNYLDGWSDNENLQLLNLIYDATPSDYVSTIITDYGMVPPTSVPVIVREYCREHLWI